MGKKTRLDLLVTERGYAPSRERAKALIMEGAVFVNGVLEDKPGAQFTEEEITSMEVRTQALPFVSRGGLKLEKAVSVWSLDFTGMVCMDIGASTGGFTDCMLQHGAKKVYAIDVGYGQLDYKLRTDPRVVCMEKTNFRYMTAERIGEAVDFASADVSFISLAKILPAAYPILKEDAYVVALIKPQFEAGREHVGKKGVVRDGRVHAQVIHRVIHEALDQGYRVRGLDFSPIQGPEGNIEYLLYLQKKPGEDASFTEEIDETVRRAQASFQKDKT